MNFQMNSENILLDKLRKQREIIKTQKNESNMLKNNQKFNESIQNKIKKAKEIKIYNEKELYNLKGRLKKINSFQNLKEKTFKKLISSSCNRSNFSSKSIDNNIYFKRKSNKIDFNLIVGKNNFSSEENKIVKETSRKNTEGLNSKEAKIIKNKSESKESPAKKLDTLTIKTQVPVDKPFETTPINLESTQIKLNRFEENLLKVDSTNLNRKDDLNNITTQQQAHNKDKKDYYFKLDNDAQFIERMQFDVYKRHSKSNRLQNYLDKVKPKIKESIRIEAFNRLIKDANRRLESKEKMREFKEKEESLKSVSKKYKKYKETEWKSIYVERFSKFEEEKNKKIEEERSEKEKIKKEEEDEMIEKTKKKVFNSKTLAKSVNKLYQQSEIIKLKLDKMKRDNDSDKEMKEIRQKLKGSSNKSYNCILSKSIKNSEDMPRKMYENVPIRNKMINKKVKKNKNKASQNIRNNEGRSIFLNNICTLLTTISSSNGTKESFAKENFTYEKEEFHIFEELRDKQECSFKINDSKMALGKKSKKNGNFFRMKYLPDKIATRIVNDILNTK